MNSLPTRTVRTSRPAERIRLSCEGVVQGVGFRPAVARLAARLELAGNVSNGPDGARIELEGRGEQLNQFLQQLPAVLPALARLDGMCCEALPLAGEETFAIRSSTIGSGRALAPADTRICAACRREQNDPADRRFHYPFISCTECGPRFSLIESLPWDRKRTTMRQFPLCAECLREYHDPGDRRFHAEQLCCPACGPRLWLLERPELATGVPRQGGARRREEVERVLARTRALLREGAVLALKGLGGYQLCCRADDAAAVLELRRRKHRPSQPFAIMVPSLAAARRLVELDPKDEALLSSPEGPILLAPARRGTPVCDAVAPGLRDLGVMLPTTPLHAELFRDPDPGVLVMSSGNRSGEPICRRDEIALERLGSLCDGILLHDREIRRRVDDSVLRTSAAAPAMVRRSRGWVAQPLKLPVDGGRAILALGAHQQVTACLAVGARAFPTQHVGDLDSADARGFLRETAAGMEDFLGRRADCVAVDAHPDLPGGRIGELMAQERGCPLVRVQHHLAHLAAVLAEHDCWPTENSVAGILLDGTGWGSDGSLWGGEWLELDADLTWSRAGSLESVPLVGSEAAIREPWRVLCAVLEREAQRSTGPKRQLLEGCMSRVAPDPGKLDKLLQLCSRPVWPLSSGAGRWFEAAGALLCGRGHNRYEGEAAAWLEALARGGHVRPGSDGIEIEPDDEHLPRLKLGGLLAGIACDRASPAESAATFHASFCRAVAEMSRRLWSGRHEWVALGGGCLVNRRLRIGLEREMNAAGFRVLMPQRIAAGDGGLAFGQCALAAAWLAAGGRADLAGPAAVARTTKR